jgi:hypothetical protein
MRPLRGQLFNTGKHPLPSHIRNVPESEEKRTAGPNPLRPRTPATQSHPSTPAARAPLRVAVFFDYKPDATTGKPFAQLSLYALVLSHLAGIPLFDFKCAWFSERQYCAFFPRTVLARKNTR